MCPVRGAQTMFGFDRKPKPDAQDNATAEADRRGAERVVAEQLPHVSAQLSTAGDIKLIDISKTGARFESHRRLPPNSSVSLRLATPESTLVVSGRVVRSRIVRLADGTLGCEVGVAFTKPLAGLLEENVTHAASVTVESTSPPADAPAETPTVPSPSKNLESAFQQLSQPVPAEHEATASATDDRARAIESLREAHAALESQLATAQRDLRKSLDAHAADRTTWDTTRETLDTQLRNARQAVTARDDVVATLQAKLGHATEAHTSARTEWETTRQQLESSLQEARTALETAKPQEPPPVPAPAEPTAELDQLKSQLDAAHEALGAWTELEASLQEDMRRVNETLATERAEWDQAREELESRLAGANSALELSETAIASVRKELTVADVARRAAEQARVEDRREFDDAIRAMQTELAKARDTERGAQADSTTKLESELALAKTELQAAQSALAAERTVWESARQQWRTTVANAEAVHADERRKLEEALRAAYADQEAARHRLEEQLRESWSRADALHIEVDGLRARLDDAAAQAAAQQVSTEHQSQEADVEPQATREEQSRHSQLLAEVGELAMAMSPQIELALGADSAQALALIRQLSRFAQKRSKILANVDLNDAVRRAEPILRQLVGIDIDLTIELGTASVIGSADIDQLLTSLVVAARDLLPMGGSLVVATGPALSVRASGYGVQAAQPLPALALLAERSGGTLRLDGKADQFSVLEVSFDR